MPEAPLAFALMLKHVPGPFGVALPATEWQIVVAGDEAVALSAAMTGTRTVLQGRSSDTGSLVLTGAEQKQLHQAWDEHSGRLWVVAEGHAHRLCLSKDTGEWNELQAQHRALDAMGYADDLYVSDGNAVENFHAQQARNDTGLNNGLALLKNIKKGVA